MTLYLILKFQDLGVFIVNDLLHKCVFVLNDLFEKSIFVPDDLFEKSILIPADTFDFSQVMALVWGYGWLQTKFQERPNDLVPA